MGYVDNNLIQGETVQYRAPLHWKVGVSPMFLAVVLVGLATVAFLQVSSHPAAALFLEIIGVFLLLVAVFRLIGVWVMMSSAEFAVTNKRVILKTGFIR